MKLGLVVPCYNEQHRLDLGSFASYNLDWIEITYLFVNDGSTDKTAEILESFCHKYPRAMLLNLDSNVGKGPAVRQGIQFFLAQNQMDFLGYWDGDLSTPLTEIGPMLKIFNKYPRVKFCLGSRLLRLGANVKRGQIRHYLGRIFATVASSILNLSVYDSQCGAKIFRADVGQKIFADSFKSKWFFDVELLFRFKQLSLPSTINHEIYEYMISTWKDRAGSKLKLTDFLSAPLEMLKLWFFYGPLKRKS